MIQNKTSNLVIHDAHIHFTKWRGKEQLHVTECVIYIFGKNGIKNFYYPTNPNIQEWKSVISLMDLMEQYFYTYFILYK